MRLSPAAVDAFTDLTVLLTATKILNVPFFGMNLPLYAFNYTGRVFPRFAGCCCWLRLRALPERKVIPSILQVVFVPMISVIVLVPGDHILVGPIGIGVGLCSLKMVDDQAPALVGALIAGCTCSWIPPNSALAAEPCHD